jgi:choline monooxygenase
MAVTIPAARYTLSAFAALENDRLWPRVWQLACSLDHVANPGDFHELRIGPLSVLLVPDDQRVWEAFVEVMGVRVGNDAQCDAGPAPEVPPGGTIRGAIAEIVRKRGVDAGHHWFDSLDEGQLLDMSQYNLFPNVTVLVFADMLQVVRSRPGDTADDAHMDAFSFERIAPPNAPGSGATPRTKPIDVSLGPDGELPIGLILNQDFANFGRSQRGLHQPGLGHMTVSPTEECRIVNLHRNLEDYLMINPSELGTLEPSLR